jgi:hypothetical protein
MAGIGWTLAVPGEVGEHDELLFVLAITPSIEYVSFDR